MNYPYYFKSNIGSFVGRMVDIVLHNGTRVSGLLDIDCLNENWEEDGEREAIVLEIDGRLELVILDEVQSIDFAKQDKKPSISKESTTTGPKEIATA